MSISWFCLFRHDDPARRLDDADRGRLAETVRTCRDLRAGYLHTPSEARHPYAGESVAPILALELEFPGVAACEDALRERGPLHHLADPDFLPSLSGTDVEQQGMLVRSFDVADPGSGGATTACCYLVHYPGPAEDERAWLGHYVASHASIMGRLPGIRVAAVYTPALVISGLPFRFASAMLRNKIVFDTAEALAAALASPVRDELRADVATFPPYAGGSVHVPMDTLIVPGSPARG